MDSGPDSRVAGLLLAAGAGRRMGGPKALVTGADGAPWVVTTSRRLLAAGCAPVRVVLGARADDSAPLLDAVGVEVVVAPDWREGMSASLRAGLRGLDLLAPDASAAVVHLVDLPDVGADAVRRLLARTAGSGPGVLARATYQGVPGHPVLLGRAHWPAVALSALGDSGARDYLAARAVTAVECADLATGVDIDRR